MSTAKRIGIAGFYWIGVAMTIACLALVLAGNTEFVWRFEHRAFPLSWAIAGIAMLAFLAAEFGHYLPSKAKVRTSQSPEWGTAEPES